MEGWLKQRPDMAGVPLLPRDDELLHGKSIPYRSMTACSSSVPIRNRAALRSMQSGPF